MKLIYNAALNAAIYIDSLDKPEESDRIKIWDSEKRYLDYFPIETLIRSAQDTKKSLCNEYLARCYAIARCKDIFELISVTSTDSFVVTPKKNTRALWEYLLSASGTPSTDINKNCSLPIEQQIEELRTYDNINFVGDYILLNLDV